MNPSPVQLSCPIGCLDLSSQIRGSLERHNADPIKTVGDLLKFAEENRLSDIRGIGSISIEMIEERLRRAGFPVRHRHEKSHLHEFEPSHTHDGNTSGAEEEAETSYEPC